MEELSFQLHATNRIRAVLQRLLFQLRHPAKKIITIVSSAAIEKAKLPSLFLERPAEQNPLLHLAAAKVLELLEKLDDNEE